MSSRAGGRKRRQYYQRAIKRHYGGELRRGLAHTQPPGDESQRHPGRALAYEANGFAESAVVRPKGNVGLHAGLRCNRRGHVLSGLEHS